MAIQKRTQMALISQITQMELHEAVGAPLRHQRDQRDLRPLLEDAMIRGSLVGMVTRFLDSLRSLGLRIPASARSE